MMPVILIGGAVISFCLYVRLDSRREGRAKLAALRARAAAADAEALCELGQDCCRQGKARLAVDMFGRAAEQGHAEAMCRLALCYMDGAGVEQNAGRAAELLQQAVSGGYAPAECLLADCYMLGDGVPRNEAQAAHLYRRGASRGEPEAQYKWGLCLLLGMGMPPNRRRALSWLRKAAESGHMEACRRLDDMNEPYDFPDGLGEASNGPQSALLSKKFFL